jgi:hypothetical protein
VISNSGENVACMLETETVIFAIRDLLSASHQGTADYVKCPPNHIGKRKHEASHVNHALILLVLMT